MAMLRVVIVLSLACSASSCMYGMTAETYPPAEGPRGVMVRVTVGQRQFSGELLEVRNSGLVILGALSATPLAASPASGGASLDVHEQLTLQFVPYGEILSSEVDRTSSRFAIKDRRTPNRDVRDHLRLLSRFPQGLSADLLQLLLREHGQTDLVDVIR